MPLTCLPGPEPGLEAPTGFAELKIEVRPAKPWRSASVPPDHVHDLITTLGILGSLTAGIAGAVLTLRTSPRLIAPAFAELAIAGTSAALIAMRRPEVAAGDSSRYREISQAATRERRPSLTSDLRCHPRDQPWAWTAAEIPRPAQLRTSSCSHHAARNQSVPGHRRDEAPPRPR
jgi:hypothetical protein